MIRIFAEYAILFLLPTLGYVALQAFQRNDWPGLGAVLSEAPLLKLFALGSACLLAAILLFSSYSGYKPGESYAPPVFKDGKVQPGHSSGLTSGGAPSR